MNPHVASCPRGKWLERELAKRPFWELFVAAFFGEGPECACPVSAEATVQP